MSIRKRHLCVTVALTVGLASPVFAAPRADASASTTVHPGQVSHEEAVPGVAPANPDAPAIYLDSYNCLYEYYTDGTWRQKACSDVERLRPGTGGSSYRTVARENCDATNEQISWRNHVDVDVVGEGDTSEWPYRQAEVYCTVN